MVPMMPFSSFSCITRDSRTKCIYSLDSLEALFARVLLFYFLAFATNSRSILIMSAGKSITWQSPQRLAFSRYSTVRASWCSVLDVRTNRGQGRTPPPRRRNRVLKSPSARRLLAISWHRFQKALRSGCISVRGFRFFWTMLASVVSRLYVLLCVQWSGCTRQNVSAGLLFVQSYIQFKTSSIVSTRNTLK